MNRRDFHKSLAALGLLPLLPTPVAAARLNASQVAWAKAISQAQGPRAPALVGQFLKVDLATAQRVCLQVSTPLGSSTTRLKKWLEADRSKPSKKGVSKLRGHLKSRTSAPQPETAEPANRPTETPANDWRPRQDSNLQPAP